MPSSTNPAFNLTISNAASTDYTLTIMTVVAVIFTPLVLLYQGWTYWIFRKRVSADRIPDVSEFATPPAAN
jgi:cytochrome d ubiquinol oxidase subunit II